MPSEQSEGRHIRIICRLDMTRLGPALAVLALLLLSPASSHASYGDQEPEYLDCVARCSAKNRCGTSDAVSLPWHLRLTLWTCNEECRYNCMHTVTDRKRASGEDIEQYYGKWPFYRLGGLQEPASIAFSLANGYQHYRGYRQVLRNMPPSYPLRTYLLVYCAVNLHAWFWSAVFHSRDFGLTERMDYFSAASIILYAAYFALVRVFRLYRSDRRGALALLTTACLLMYAAHVGYLASLERFDYSYNVIACATVGILSNILWVIWAIVSRSRPYAWRIAAMAIGISLFTGLELFDFPPVWGVFDAHSLWHASTILLVRGFYDFVRADTEWEIRSGFNGKEKVGS